MGEHLKYLAWAQGRPICVLLGHTTGRGKNDHTNKPNRLIKEILGLPLTPRFRRLLSEL